MAIYARISIHSGGQRLRDLPVSRLNISFVACNCGYLLIWVCCPVMRRSHSVRFRLYRGVCIRSRQPVGDAGKLLIPVYLLNGQTPPQAASVVRRLANSEMLQLGTHGLSHPAWISGTWISAFSFVRYGFRVGMLLLCFWTKDSPTARHKPAHAALMAVTASGIVTRIDRHTTPTSVGSTAYSLCLWNFSSHCGLRD